MGILKGLLSGLRTLHSVGHCHLVSVSALNGPQEGIAEIHG